MSRRKIEVMEEREEDASKQMKMASDTADESKPTLDDMAPEEIVTKGRKCKAISAQKTCELLKVRSPVRKGRPSKKNENPPAFIKEIEDIGEEESTISTGYTSTSCEKAGDLGDFINTSSKFDELVSLMKEKEVSIEELLQLATEKSGKQTSNDRESSVERKGGGHDTAKSRLLKKSGKQTSNDRESSVECKGGGHDTAKSRLLKKSVAKLNFKSATPKTVPLKFKEKTLKIGHNKITKRRKMKKKIELSKPYISDSDESAIDENIQIPKGTDSVIISANKLHQEETSCESEMSLKDDKPAGQEGSSEIIGFIFDKNIDPDTAKELQDTVSLLDKSIDVLNTESPFEVLKLIKDQDSSKNVHRKHSQLNKSSDTSEIQDETEEPIDLNDSNEKPDLNGMNHNNIENIQGDSVGNLYKEVNTIRKVDDEMEISNSEEDLMAEVHDHMSEKVNDVENNGDNFEIKRSNLTILKSCRTDEVKKKRNLQTSDDSSRKMKMFCRKDNVEKSERNKWGEDESHISEELIYSDDEKEGRISPTSRVSLDTQMSRKDHTENVSRCLTVTTEDTNDLLEEIHCQISPLNNSPLEELESLIGSSCMDSSTEIDQDINRDMETAPRVASHTKRQLLKRRILLNKIKKENTNDLKVKNAKLQMCMKRNRAKIRKLLKKQLVKMESDIKPDSEGINESLSKMSANLNSSLSNMKDDLKFKELSLSKSLENPSESILDTDIPIVEVFHKEECLHGILALNDGLDFHKYCSSEVKNKSPLPNSFFLCSNKVKKFLRSLCREHLTKNICDKAMICNKSHKVNKDIFSSLNENDLWFVINFVLRISEKVSQNFFESVLEILGTKKQTEQVFEISRTLFKIQHADLHYLKTCWESLFETLHNCGCGRIDAMREVLKYNLAVPEKPKTETIVKILGMWNILSPSFKNSWRVLECLTDFEGFVLPPLILSKLITEVLSSSDLPDKKSIYVKLTQQLIALPSAKLKQVCYRILNDFLEVLIKNDFHHEEKILRKKMFPFYEDNRKPPSETRSFSPLTTSSPTLPLRRCKSMTTLAMVKQERPEDSTVLVHEAEKMEAAVIRSLVTNNYEKVVNILVNCSKKKFAVNLLQTVYSHLKEKNTLIILKNMITKLKSYPASYVEETKQLFGMIVVTFMLLHVKKYEWKEAFNYYCLIEDNKMNKCTIKPLHDTSFNPVRLAITYSEINFYNNRHKESIGILINMKLLNPDPTEWLIKGGSAEDFKIINVMITFLMSKFQCNKITNIATMLFKSVLEVQSNLNEPINIGEYYEPLLYDLFELVAQYPETALKLYIRVAAKDPHLNLYGLTYRALLVLAYRHRRHSVIKDLFYRAIQEYAYPIFEGKDKTIMLLTSFLEEEMTIYITEWIAWFGEKMIEIGRPFSGHKVFITFKSNVELCDFLDSKSLGVPAILREVDQSLPAALTRLEGILKKLPLQAKQTNKDTFLIDPPALHAFIQKIVNE